MLWSNPAFDISKVFRSSVDHFIFMHATDLFSFCGYEMLLPFQRLTTSTYRFNQSTCLLY